MVHEAQRLAPKQAATQSDFISGGVGSFLAVGLDAAQDAARASSDREIYFEQLIKSLSKLSTDINHCANSGGDLLGRDVPLLHQILNDQIRRKQELGKQLPHLLSTQAKRSLRPVS